MRYDYECSQCSQRWEHSCSMAERPDVLPCPCGGEAQQIISCVPDSFVKGRPFTFDPSKNVASYGRQFGRSDAQQHQHYQRVIEQQRQQVAAMNRSLSKEDKKFEFIGCAPGEAVDSFNNNVGAKETAQTNPVDFYKRLGTYMGRD